MYKVFAYSIKSHVFGVISEHSFKQSAVEALNKFSKKHWGPGTNGFLQLGVCHEGKLIYPKKSVDQMIPV